MLQIIKEIIVECYTMLFVITVIGITMYLNKKSKIINNES